MNKKNWGRTYERWEEDQNMANDESVLEAESYERTGWPLPISGDLLAIKLYEDRLCLERDVCTHG